MRTRDRSLPASPARRRLIGLALAAPAALALGADGAEPAERAGDPIAALAAEGDFSGSILVRSRGEVVYARSFGLASRAFAVANTLRTRHPIASITKTFTATLILDLHERGQLDLHRPVVAYLPEFRREGTGAITAHHLLNHTAGLPNFDAGNSLERALSEGLPAYQRPMTRAQLFERACSGAPVAAPGTAFDYNNGDYIVLGALIERLHGRPLEAVLAGRILDPLGLADTGLLRQSDVIDRLATGYFHRDDLDAYVNDLPVYPENWYAAGAMYSTVGDLLAFADALFGGRVIGPPALALMLAPGLDDYGYGLWSYTIKIGQRRSRVAKRPGRIMGAQGQLFRMLDEDVTVVLLSNAARGDLDALVARIGRLYAA